MVNFRLQNLLRIMDFPLQMLYLRKIPPSRPEPFAAADADTKSYNNKRRSGETRHKKI